MSYYATEIAKAAPGYDPRHIEAYMRLQYATLDHLDRATFRREISICTSCVDADGADRAEELARSFGL